MDIGYEWKRTLVVWEVSGGNPTTYPILQQPQSIFY